MKNDLNKKTIFIMGVSGSGKSLIGQMLASKLSVPFVDADDHHPASNIDKMRSGFPLNDEDRLPWLDQLNSIARDHVDSGCVIACSALKATYRLRLQDAIESSVLWIYLKGTYDQIFDRMNNREDHFMGAGMLRSQFETLEEPDNAIAVDITDQPVIIVQNIINAFEMKTEFGVIGMGVMGKSLSRNLARNGFTISVFNRHVEGKEENIAADFINQYPEMKNSIAYDDLKTFVYSLSTPRKIMMMVNAGSAVDAVLEELSGLLETGDVVIDGGNSHFDDTRRRIERMNECGLIFIGAGISGGEEGALKGPSIMPSGDQLGYKNVQQYLEAIAAKDEDGNPCCTYIGNYGSGHFVKMIHNGIEYVEMQLLAECYSILKSQGQSNEEISAVFESWKKELSSYLLSITIDILRKKDGDQYLLDQILDKAGNKGTGNWATIAIADSGEPSTLIPAALFARYLSFFKEQRVHASGIYKTHNAGINIDTRQLKSAYQFGRIINHHQGFATIANISNRNNWNVDLSEIARIWTEGCIIKSDFMKELVGLLKTESSILFHEKVAPVIQQAHSAMQAVVVGCIQLEIHVPCLLEALNFYHGLKTRDSSANLIQAQRDYFGAHSYQRKDNPSGKSYHTEW